MKEYNYRDADFNADPRFAAIRLARVWVQADIWAKRQDLTFSEQRKMVADRHDEAKKGVAHVQALSAQRERAERKFGAELRTLREERDMLENKPWGVNIQHLKAEIDKQINEIIQSA